MLPEDKFFYTLSDEEIWERYCSFLDLSVEEFMEIQKRLLLEEVGLAADSYLGRKIMGGASPRTVEEFRQLVPLTTYEDYEPYLSEQREDVLAEKPLFWCHSAGRGGSFKWIPYTRAAFDQVAKRSISAFILATARRKGGINIRPGFNLLANVAPRPYTSGTALYFIPTLSFSFNLIPPSEEADRLGFQERIARGFEIGLRTGTDVIFSIGSVLVKLGEHMTSQAQMTKLSLSLLHPAVLYRLARAYLRSKMARRQILPRDIWQPKAVLTGGTDATIYKDQIAYYWGQVPYEIYGSTESFGAAFLAWNKKWLTFVPDIAFWEFIPTEERLKNVKNREYQPRTVLMNEVESGKDYEVVLTQLHGMPLLRYRLGDLMTVMALKDGEAGINLPQWVFKTRLGDIIDLAALAVLDEKTVWQAIINSGIKYEEWSARKEYDGGQTYLRLYMELKEDKAADEVGHLIDRQLRVIDVDYRDVGDQLGLQPVRVSLLRPGTFQRYYLEKQEEGADLAHMKPPHMNPTDNAVEKLLRLSQRSQERL
jgi:hypothetical protein